MQNPQKEIHNLRSQIDQIHIDLGRLFQQRLQINLQIWKLKTASDIPLIDSDRENDLIHKFDNLTRNENEKIALQNFFKTILAESKNFTGNEIK